MDRKATICIAEDRAACEPCLRILILSLHAHCPRAEINLFYPGGPEFLAWVRKFPQVRLQKLRLPRSIGWNVKPQAILQLLDQGFDEVIWMDSDIVVTRNIAPIFAGLGDSALAVSEEGRDPNAIRARLWGFPVGRTLPFAVNSGIIRATKTHYRLIKRWWELLQTDEYQQAQQRGWTNSPIHMKGDQDVLTALLTSSQFSHIPVSLIRRGRDVVLFDGIFGYSVADRLRQLLTGTAPLIHITAMKPWSASWRLNRPFTVKEYIEQVYFDVSPYTVCALRYRDSMDCEAGWMRPHRLPSRILRAVGIGCPALVGLPIAILADLVRLAKSASRLRRSRRPPITVQSQ